MIVLYIVLYAIIAITSLRLLTRWWTGSTRPASGRNAIAVFRVGARAERGRA